MKKKPKEIPLTMQWWDYERQFGLSKRKRRKKAIIIILVIQT